MFNGSYLPICAAVLVIASCGGSSSSGTAVKTTTTTITTGAPTTTSTGKATPNSPIPKVVGDSEDTALAVLKKADFKVKVTQIYSNSPIGTVLAQDPAPGKTAPNGSTVTLTLSG